jgi:hypothetical protein
MGFVVAGCSATQGDPSGVVPANENDVDTLAATASLAQLANFVVLVFSPVTAGSASEAAAQLESGVSGCVGAARDRNDPAVLLRFYGCSGPFGLSDLNGTLRVAFSDASPLHAEQSSSLTSNGQPVAYTASTDTTATGQTRSVGWVGTWDQEHVATRGVLNLAVDARTRCATLRGDTTTRVGDRSVQLHMDGWSVCRCPSGALDVTFQPSGVTATVSFDGTATAHITVSGETTRALTLECPP